jgi:hypothetical protein
MQFIPADAYQYMHMMGGGTFPVVSGSEMAQYAAWVETQTPQSSATPTTSAASHTSFYFVLAFPQGDYADKIDDSANYPMWVPASGTTPKILGIFSDEKEATVKMDEDVENVHVMYQCRLGGRDEITEFLEFMAEHDMLAPTSGR